MLLLWAWRGHFGLPFVAAPAPALTPVFVEVAGIAPRPGVYTFPKPPTLSEVLSQAGAAAPLEPGATRLKSGVKVEVLAGGRCRLGRMSGPRLLTLGLALDVNQATAEDLDGLPGIGPVLARRIVDYRQSHGPFKKIDELENVSGIGPKKLEQLRPYVIVAEEGNEE